MPRFEANRIICSKSRTKRQKNRAQIFLSKARAGGIYGMRTREARHRSGMWGTWGSRDRWVGKSTSSSFCTGVTRLWASTPSKGHWVDTYTCLVGESVVLASINGLSLNQAHLTPRTWTTTQANILLLKLHAPWRNASFKMILIREGRWSRFSPRFHTPTPRCGPEGYALPFTRVTAAARMWTRSHRDWGLAFCFEIFQANHSWHLGALSASFLSHDIRISVVPEIDWLAAWSTRWRWGAWRVCSPVMLPQ